MDDLLLREICRITGVSRRAIQGYEKEGLVMSCGKNKYGYLLYSSTTIERIKEIKLYQERGFSMVRMKGLEVACSARKVQNSLILLGILDLLYCNKRNSTLGVRNGIVRIVLTLHS